MRVQIANDNRVWPCITDRYHITCEYITTIDIAHLLYVCIMYYVCTLVCIKLCQTVYTNDDIIALDHMSLRGIGNRIL
jgi:hypothetical protein